MPDRSVVDPATAAEAAIERHDQAAKKSQRYFALIEGGKAG